MIQQHKEYDIVGKCKDCGKPITFRSWDYQRHRYKLHCYIYGYRLFIPRCSECFKNTIIVVPHVAK